MSWTTVGFHAVEQKLFDEMAMKDADASSVSMSFATWYSTPLCAISQTRKENVRKLGLSLTETVDPDPKAKVALKRGYGKSRVDAALETPNFVVWRLQTQENIAELVSKGVLLGGHNKFHLKEPVGPFRLFSPAGKWVLEYACFVCMMTVWFEHTGLLSGRYVS